MALIPKKFKYKKYFKGKIRTINKNKKIHFGDIAIKAVESARLTIKQIEATRRAIKKIIKPFGGIIRVKLRAYLPVTSKPLAVRMGRGKGKVALNICPVKKGTILFEVACIEKEIAIKATKVGAYKLPLKVLIISKTLK
jgi:large subunit ribosomal protein L16